VDSFAAPSNLIGSINGTSAVLSWKDNASDEDGFTIERAVKIRGAVAFEAIGQVQANQTSFTDACGSGTFYYRVRAFKAGTKSGYSNEVTVRIK
jgi:hypothetical protein